MENKIKHHLTQKAHVFLSDKDRKLIESALNDKNINELSKTLGVARQQIYLWKHAKKIELKRCLFLQAALKIQIVTKKNLDSYVNDLLKDSEIYGLSIEVNQLENNYHQKLNQLNSLTN